MPTYEYVCQSCGTHVEVYQRFSDEPLFECGVCGGRLRKVFHPAGILFKGSGFYVTDSRAGRSGQRGEGKAASGSSERESQGASSSGSTRGQDPGGSKEAKKEAKKDSPGSAKERSA